MAVSYFAEDVKMPAIKKRETTDWIRRVASEYGKKCGDIAYIFCSDEKILEVNKAYLQHDYYTDVITFGMRRTAKIDAINKPETLDHNGPSGLTEPYSANTRGPLP